MDGIFSIIVSHLRFIGRENTKMMNRLMEVLFGINIDDVN